MSIPKEPRALMIQLMYLVLTAMLALNITKEVLDAFSTINTSIENSNDGIKKKNDRTYTAFDKIADKNPDLKPKRDLLYPKALDIKAESEKMIKYLEEWKEKIVTTSGGWETLPTGEKKIKVMDDIDIPTRMFVEDKANNGAAVRKQLQDYVDKIIAIGAADNNEKEILKERLPIKLPDLKKTDNNPSGDWAFGTFHNIPVVAAVTLFSKWQSDVRNAEAIMVENLMGKVGEEEFDPTIFKLDGMQAIATPNISYALDGDEITATIVMAAYSTTANPTISSNRGAVPVKDGVGTLKFRASGTGMQTVKGTITVPTKGSKVETRPWEFSYMVGNEGASLQLDYMNVMYVGVDNPVTISASGYNLGDVTWTMAGADIKSTGPGKYNVRVNTPNYNGVEYKVIAKTKSGASKEVAKGLIRIKNIPAPILQVGKVQGFGYMGTGEIKAQTGIAAVLEGFDFKFRYLVTTYDFVLTQKGSEDIKTARGNGPFFSNEIKNLIALVKPGDKVQFENVKVKGEGVPERPAKGALIVNIR